MKRFMRIAAVFSVLAIGGFAFLYVRFKPDEKGRVIPWGERIDTSVLAEFRSSLKVHEDLVILEGLPHQRLERGRLKSELRSKETTKIHGFHFYSKVLSRSPDDVHALIAALSDEAGIAEWAGGKLCGGYHPDYAIRWNDSGGRTFEALICFGCGEIKLYGGGLQLYADLTEH